MKTYYAILAILILGCASRKENSFGSNVVFRDHITRFKPRETEINWSDTIKKLKHLDLNYTQQFHWADSDDTDFLIKQRLVKKKVHFKKFDNNIVVTAYFEVNACDTYFPNIERNGDTVILKDQILYNDSCVENIKVIKKINFIIYNGYTTKIRTVLAQ